MLNWVISMVAVVAMVTMTLCEGFSTCDPISACSCRSEDGVIDLSPLDGQGTPGLSAPGTTYTYYYNPCTPFTMGLCSNAAICEVSPDSGYQRDAGMHSTATFLSVEEGVTIKMEDSVSYVTSLIKLVCDHNQEGTFQLLKDEYPIYNFQLISKYSCPAGGGGSGGGGLSIGSILCIVLLVLICVYLIGGGVYNRTVREANGADVIPNVSFWKELPLLIKDGVMFAASGCKSKSYEEI